MRLRPLNLFPRQTPALPTEVPAGLPKEVPAGLPKEVPAGLPKDVPAGLPKEVPPGVNVPSAVPPGLASAIPTNNKSPSATGTPAAAASGTPSPTGIMGTVGDVKDSFTSWDKCMAKTYCKWPVIAVIVVGSLILLSVLFCIGRCLCCGAECACCCFRCCVGCCGGGKTKKHKHLDPPPAGNMPSQAWDQQYRSQPQPVYAAAPALTPFQAASAASVPQFATFEAPSGKIHEDSLPAMPSWETAAQKKVEVWEEPEAHELEKLNPNGQATTTTLDTGVASPQPVRPAIGPPSPYSEHDAFLKSSNHQYGASQYSLSGGQTMGVARGDGYHSPAPQQRGDGYNSPAPQAYGGYGQYNDSRHNVGQSYGQQQQQQQQSYGGSQQNFGRPQDDHRSPVSPVYSGSTAYEPSRQQDHSPPYGNAAMYSQQGRKPLNGSWKDV